MFHIYDRYVINTSYHRKLWYHSMCSTNYNLVRFYLSNNLLFLRILTSPHILTENLSSHHRIRRSYKQITCVYSIACVRKQALWRRHHYSDEFVSQLSESNRQMFLPRLVCVCLSNTRPPILADKPHCYGWSDGPCLRQQDGVLHPPS